MSQTTDAIEMQQSTPPVDSGSDEGQCWRDVKAETGFSSYIEFLEALLEKEPRFDALLKDLREWRRYGSDFSEVVILDILQDGSTSISLKTQDDNDSSAQPWDYRRELSTQVLQNLRSPPENVPARIVFWSLLRSSLMMNLNMIDALGLGLDVHPSFFENLLRFWSLDPSTMRRRPNRLDNIIIGDCIATVARNYRPGGRAPPILLIVGAPDLKHSIWQASHARFWSRSEDFDKAFDEAYSEAVVEVLNEDFGDRVSPHHWKIKSRPADTLASIPVRYYLRVHGSHIQESGRLDSRDDALLWMAILPLLNLETLRLRVQCEMLNSVLIELQLSVEYPQYFSEESKPKIYDNLDEQRFWLRRRLEGLQESRNHFIKFVNSQNAVKWLKSKAWIGQEKVIREALTEARAKEAEVRDYMQLQIGNLSILESRKSIQLSNQQIKEAKRGMDCDLTNSRLCC